MVTLSPSSYLTGAKYDKDGNLANWWSRTSLDNFKKREECLVRQYDQCLVQGHQVRNVIF